MKTFSLDEAQTLIPVLESLMKSALESKSAAEQIAEDLQALNQRIFLNGGTLVRIGETAKKRATHDKAVQQVKDTLAEIDAIGVQVKDLDTGLLDFPCMLGDDVVLLCWKRGESEIGHWHAMDAGFAGRQPLDERFRRARKQKPN